jgi:hypothetical protein
MKWVKFKNEMDPNIPNGEKKFFEPIPVPKSNSGKKDKDGFSEDIRLIFEANGFEKWVTYPVLPGLGKRAARKYEIFCGGFLYYHDVELKLKLEGKKFEHKIFFEWLPKGKGVKKDKVKIYINSTPAQFNPNPPHPPAPPPPESNP